MPSETSVGRILCEARSAGNEIAERVKYWNATRRDPAFDPLTQRREGERRKVEPIVDTPEFFDCSPVMVLNAVGFEFARNLAVRCDSVFSLLNCSECRLEFNELFDAPCGFKLSGTRLTECFRNRFTDCDVGLLAYYCRENRFMGNAFFGGRDGMQLWSAGPNGVFSGNRFEGVRTPFAKREKTDPTNSFINNEIKKEE